MSKRRVVAVAVAVLFLSGCAAPAPVAESSAPAAPPTATPTPHPIDVTVMPENRFGIDCASLIPAADVESVFGVQLPLASPDRFDTDHSEVLIQNRELRCRWGERNFLDGESPSITVIATPGARAALDSLVASFNPAGHNSAAVAVAGVGDAAWVSCSADGSAPVDTRCSWVVAVEETWVVVTFTRATEAEATVTPVGTYGQLDAAPRTDSPGAAVVARVATALRGVPVAEVPEPGLLSPGCDALVDWQALSDEFGLGPAEVETTSYQPFFGELGYLVIGNLTTHAAAARGAVGCYVSMGTPDQLGQTYVIVRVLPDAGWIGSTTLWGGWGAESCHGWEGGPICEVSGYANGRAAFVIVAGAIANGLADRTFQALTSG